MLTIADSLTIMNVLNAVDGNSIKSTALRAESSATGIGTGKYLTNSRLFSFVEAADPTQSFLDLSIKLDEPVEEVQRSISITSTSINIIGATLIFSFYLWQAIYKAGRWQT